MAEARGSIPLSSTPSLARSLLRGASSADLAASGGRSGATEACLAESVAQPAAGFKYRPSTSTFPTPAVTTDRAPAPASAWAAQISGRRRPHAGTSSPWRRAHALTSAVVGVSGATSPGGRQRRHERCGAAIVEMVGDRRAEEPVGPLLGERAGLGEHNGHGGESRCGLTETLGDHGGLHVAQLGAACTDSSSCSTCSWRDNEEVIEPRSRSIVPSATDHIRFSTVTLTISPEGRGARARPRRRATRVQRYRNFPPACRSRPRRKRPRGLAVAEGDGVGALDLIQGAVEAARTPARLG